jgi:hypothetical protein
MSPLDGVRVSYLLESRRLAVIYGNLQRPVYYLICLYDWILVSAEVN